jgi:hypothetical protein
MAGTSSDGTTAIDGGLGRYLELLPLPLMRRFSQSSIQGRPLECASGTKLPTTMRRLRVRGNCGERMLQCIGEEQRQQKRGEARAPRRRHREIVAEVDMLR